MKYGVSSNTLLLTEKPADGRIGNPKSLNRNSRNRMAGCRYQHSPYRHFLLDNGCALLVAQGLRG